MLRRRSPHASQRRCRSAQTAAWALTVRRWIAASVVLPSAIDAAILVCEGIDYAQSKAVFKA